MKTYDVVCPICGAINRNLDLEETDGWMECEECKNTSLTRVSDNSTRIPVLTIKQLERVLTTT